MTALIIDDEKPNRDGLKLLLRENCPQVKIIYEADSAASAREQCRKNKTDILFLDINLPNENGFEFLNSVPDLKAAVVFVTAYSEFAVRAFKANAVDYLLKPVDADELVLAVKRCIGRLLQHSENGRTENIIDSSIINLKTDFKNKSYPAKLTLPHLQGFTIVETENIIFIEADGNYSVLHLTNGNTLVVTRALREFEFLVDPAVFFRAHKSSLINLHYVLEYSSVDGHFALMKNGNKVDISRRKLEEFMSAIDKLSSRI